MANKRWIVAPVALCTALASSEAAAENLVTNSGFESGANGWSGGAVVQDAPHSGASCLSVVDDSATASISASSGLIPISKGQAYAFEVWSRAAVSGQKAMVSITQHDASSNWLSGKNQDFVVTPGTDWSRFRITIQSFDSQAASVRIVLRPVPWSEQGEATGSAFFDDLLLEPTGQGGVVKGSWLVPSGNNRVWLGSTDQNVYPNNPLADSAALADSIVVHGARGEYEAFQLVLLPSQDDQLTGLTVTQLDGPSGAAIPQKNITAREVAYVDITAPTDIVSFAGPAPDPLPLLQPPIGLSGAKQQPLWLTLQIPESAAPGDYAGKVSLTFAKGGPLELPLHVHVWDFPIPKDHHQRSAFGLSTGMMSRYHNLGDDTDKKRQTFQLYLQDFAAHRLEPNNPFGYDSYSINYPGWQWYNSQIVEDPDLGAANHVLEVNDTKTDASVAGSSGVLMPIEAGKNYKLSWRVKTEGAHDYLVSITQHDASGKWLSGHNIDFAKAGDGSWQSGAETILASDLFTPTAAKVSINLFARAWSGAGEKTGRTFFDNVVFAEEGTPTNLFPNGNLDTGVENAVPSIDFSRFDPAAEKIFGELGITSFQLWLEGFATMSYQGYQGGELLGLQWGTPEYEKLFSTTVKAITDHLYDKGWLDKAYVYNLDEPQDDAYPFVVQAMSLLHKADPRLKRLLTEQYEPALEGSVDIWSPILDQWDYSWAKARQAKGEQVWWYVCTWPRAPYFTYFIDHPAIERRVSMWLAAKYGVQGTLYWQSNYWTNDQVNPPPGYQDPWADPMSYNFDTGAKGTWGNGDGRLLYPPRTWKDGIARVEGPTPSARWEQLRDGLEDFEYFWLLRTLADQLEALGQEPQMVSEARALLEIPKELASTPTEFTDDPGALAAYRVKIGELLERMHATTGGPDLDGGAGGQGSDDSSVDGAAMDGASSDGAVGGSTAGAQDSGGSDGCGCRSAGKDKGAWPVILGVVGAALGLARRGRRRPEAQGLERPTVAARD